MDADRRRSAPKSLLDLLAGIQTGIIGGLIMLLWFALTSPLTGQPWWIVHNALASRFYSERQVFAGPGISTWVGAAFLLTSAGIAGAINGILTPGGRLFGLAVALAWYLLCYLYLWKRIAPLMFVFPSQGLIVAGFFLYGSTLGWHGHFVRRLRP